jgi:hypothetical protein
MAAVSVGGRRAAWRWVAALALVAGCRELEADEGRDHRDASAEDASAAVAADEAAPEGLGLGPLPVAKQGVTDFTFGLPPDVLDRRYAKLRDAGIGLKKYDYHWRTIENDDAGPSTPAPRVCPATHTLYPADEDERIAKGYFRFHCYATGLVAAFDEMLARDAQSGIQSAVVLWKSPPMYRHPGCKPAKGQAALDGCVPRDDAMGDFEDYVNFLASRYDGGPFGKISHFIVWNEVDFGTWFNVSPTVSEAARFTPRGRKTLVAKYAAMLRAASRAIKRHVPDAAMYAAMSAEWDTQPSDFPHKGAIGMHPFLDELWRQIGVSIDWRLVVHPYGPPKASKYPKGFQFADLGKLYNYQAQQLRKHGRRGPPLSYPQVYMLASEQAPLPLKSPDPSYRKRGEFICQAHDEVMKHAWIVGTTHIYLQALTPGQRPMVTPFVPYEAGMDLAGVDGVPAWQAYQATSPARWGRTRDHYCCRLFKLGCPRR